MMVGIVMVLPQVDHVTGGHPVEELHIANTGDVDGSVDLVNQRIIGILDEVGCRLSASASIQQDGEKQDSPSLDDSGQAIRNTIHEFFPRWFRLSFFKLTRA
jgi:hypothetical protein